MKDIICKILIEAIQDQDQYLDQPVDLSNGDDSILYAEGGQLDSLGLITIIADIEQKILSLTGKNVDLANERDLSINGTDFNTFGNMVFYIENQINCSV